MPRFFWLRVCRILAIIVGLVLVESTAAPALGQELHRLFDLPDDQIKSVLVTTPQSNLPDDPAEFVVDAP